MAKGDAPVNGGSDRAQQTPASSGPGKDASAEPSGAKPARTAAHRLPTGAYPAVTEKSSPAPPREEAELESGALFRPAGAGTPQAGAGDVQATVKVSAIRPPPASDATVVSPLVPPADKKDGKADGQQPEGAADKPVEPDRSASPSRSG